jgi:DNA-binding MarR family transcriptional regulator
MLARVSVDRYIIDSLMPDLVGHDRQPSAFLVYLYLWRRGTGRRQRRSRASLQQIAADTGLSKSAVQHALRTLKRRRLVQSRQTAATSVPEYLVQMPWVRK